MGVINRRTTGEHLWGIPWAERDDPSKNWKWDCDPKNCPDPRYRHNFRHGLRLPKSGSLLRGLDSDYGTSFKCSACHCGA